MSFGMVIDFENLKKNIKKPQLWRVGVHHNTK